MKNKPLATDIVIIGGGIMSITLATIINELNPKTKVTLIERLPNCGDESSKGLNNAGTGHAGYCELNYTPIKKGKIDVDRAIKINEMFETSLQFWAYLDTKYAHFKPEKFLYKTPHISFVTGKKDVLFLKKRYEQLRKNPVFKGMQFTTNINKIHRWSPLLLKERKSIKDIAATKVDHGTDINFGELISQLLVILKKNPNFKLLLKNEVTTIVRNSNQNWEVTIRKTVRKKDEIIEAPKIFIGAGGGSISLLQKMNIKEIRGYGGFPLSGRWLVCTNSKIIRQHRAKVYGQALPKTPSMSIPHLDIRNIGDKQVLMFGPFAGFTFKFLKNGSVLDFPRSIKVNNIFTLSKILISNLKLIKFLITQSLFTHNQRMKLLKKYYPAASNSDWKLLIAGQRVQIVKNCPREGVRLEFGTEIIYVEDRSLAGLIGASPGASTSAHLMLNAAKNLFPKFNNDLIKNIIPGYNVDLNKDPKILSLIRKKVYTQLKLW